MKSKSSDSKITEKQLRDYQEQLEKLVEERTAELKESEQKCRDIFEDAVVGIYQTTPEGRFLMVNPYCAQLHGYESPEELVRSVTDIATQLYVEPEHRKNFLALMEKDGIVRNFEMQARRKDGAIIRLSLNAHSVKDGNGKIIWYDGVLQDITEKKLTQELVVRQRDLALRLAQADSLEEGLSTVLQTAVTASGMESGAILLINNETNGFDIVHSIGLTKDFMEKGKQVLVESSTWSRMVEKKSFHIRPNEDLNPIALEEGFRFISLMPILQKDEVIGLLLMASKIFTDLPEHIRTGLELIAAESGNVIARIQVRERLEKEVLIRRAAEEALEGERRSLEEANTSLMEANTALKVLLKHREEDKKELEEKVLANVQQLVMPHVKKLKKGALDPIQHMSIGFIESSLDEILSPFLHTMQAFNFTPRELEVATLVREGKTTKDIASLLNVSKDAVDLLRFQIRKKLGLNKVKINLQSYLKSHE